MIPKNIHEKCTQKLNTMTQNINEIICQQYEIYRNNVRSGTIMCLKIKCKQVT